MDKEREATLIKRLRKCMALSASAEPHEAAAALRQAQALMRELGVTADDLDTLGIAIESRVVKTREGFGNCATLTWMCNVLKMALGVDWVFERNPGTAGRANVRYWGTPSRVIMAEYAHQVLWRSMMHAWDRFLLDNCTKKGKGGARQSFVRGYVTAVRSKLESLVISPAETAAMDRAKALHYEGGLLDTTVGAKVDPMLSMLGRAAGEAFDINRPMTEQRKRLGGGS
jgi:hypothetical protein